jgi:formylglycine-generating enzyme required for sulfatase activity
MTERGPRAFVELTMNVPAGRQRYMMLGAVWLLITLALVWWSMADHEHGEPDQSEPAPTTAPPVPTGAPSASVSAQPTASAAVPTCPAGEVYIPATGPEGFIMGKGFTMHGGAFKLRKGHRADSDKPHRVVLTAAFCMDETEVTVAAYQRCVKRDACVEPKIEEWWANYPRRPDHPVNEVAWPKAKAFCKAHDKDLPTEAQWEWAATGGDGRKWPWGNDEPTCEHADLTAGVLVSPGGDSGCDGGGTSPVKTHPKGVKRWPGGALHDMAGNVWEWCDDSYVPYSEGEAIDPNVQRASSSLRVLRGGAWNRPALGVQTSFRGAAINSYEVPGNGFRCVRNAIATR